MCVLSANDGQCVYWCGREAQAMDHVVPFANGGSDDLDNLLPACARCNHEKQGRDPVRWYIATSMNETWHGRGSLTSRGPGGETGLRGRYLTFHEEVLGILDDLETAAAEVQDHARQMWFLDRFFHLGYTRADNFWSPGLALHFYKDVIAKAREAGFPTGGPASR
ncbi:HNH endonuclease [Streptomyces sp. NPDC056402]|uniref:HNH endonuclease n=1 Tax=Streptomyces sp. NPDC056402 TaxID=3345810 RepID=UPI0035DA522E